MAANAVNNILRVVKNVRFGGAASAQEFTKPVYIADLLDSTSNVANRELSTLFSANRDGDFQKEYRFSDNSNHVARVLLRVPRGDEFTAVIEGTKKRGARRKVDGAFIWVSVKFKGNKWYSRSDVGKKIRQAARSLYNKDEYDLGDLNEGLDADGFDVMEIVDQPYAQRDRKVRAMHKFSAGGPVRSLEAKFTVQPMVMKAFPCIYEALTVIYYAATHNGERFSSENYDKWKCYVLLRFNRESHQMQQLCYGGDVFRAVEYFTAKYNIPVEVFNVNNHAEEMSNIYKRIECEDPVPTYFLVYYGIHVFPTRIDNLQLICEHMSRRIASFTGKRETCFAVYPYILYQLNREWQLCQLLGNRAHEFNIGTTLYKQMLDFGLIGNNDGQISIRDIIIGGRFSPQSRKKFKSSLQQGLFREHTVLNNAQSDEAIREVINNNSEALTEEQKEKTIYGLVQECKKIQMCSKITEGWNADVKQTITDKIRATRVDQFNRTGLAALDIETAIDNTGFYAYYNMIPFTLSLYGRLQKMVTFINDHGNVVTQVELVEVDEVFTGLGMSCCVKQFMEYIIRNGYCWIDYVANNEINKEPSPSTPLPQLYNYIFAHNGFKFDFRFLYNEMCKYMTDFKIIGDMNQTKMIKGNGLFLYDFALIYKEKLSTLAKTFFPKDESLHKISTVDIIDIPIDTIEQWLHDEQVTGKRHEQLEEINRYCRQDSIVLYRIVEKFFFDLYTNPYGHSFMRTPFYHSLSSIAWSMFETCYLTKPIFINKAVQAIEKLRKIGGLSLVSLILGGCGVALDVNSFYPAIMCNLMPYIYMFMDEKAIEKYKAGTKICRSDIYEIKFKFPPTQTMPTFTVKTGDSLILPLMSEDFDNNTDIENRIWVTGDAILIARKCDPDVQIKIYRQVRYDTHPIFKQFVLDNYNKRLDAKRRGDSVQVQFFKGILNSCFGKTIEKHYPQVIVGTMDEMNDMLTQLKQLGDDVVDIDPITRIMTKDDLELYQLKYRIIGDDFNHKGTMGRFGSFIMEIARNHLLLAKHLIMKELGKDCVVYCDTDSLFIRFDAFDPMLQLTIQQLLLQAEGLDEQDDQKYQQLLEQIYKLIKESKAMQVLNGMTIRDVCNIHDEQAQLPLIDDNRLGAFKIERYFIDIRCLGSKQYGFRQITRDEDKRMKIVEIVKLKGVRESKRSYQLLESIKVFQSQPNAFAMVEDVRLQAVGAGVMRSSIIKILADTLYKRKYSINEATGEYTSQPFETVSAYKEHKRERLKLIHEAKIKFKESIDEEELEEDQFYRDFVSDVVHTANERTKQAQEMFGYYDRISESQKRFLLGLPSFRYDEFQKKVLQALSYPVEQNQFVNMIYDMFIYMYQQFQKFVLLRAIERRTVDEQLSIQDQHEEDQTVMTDDDQAAVFTYLFLIRHYFVEILKQDLPRNVQMLCERAFSCYKAYVIEDDEYDQALFAHRQAHVAKQADYTAIFIEIFQFLSVPIPLPNDQGEILELSLDQNMLCTNLWRVLQNFRVYIRSRLYAQEQLHQYGYSNEMSQWEQVRAFMMLPLKDTRIDSASHVFDRWRKSMGTDKVDEKLQRKRLKTMVKLFEIENDPAAVSLMRRLQNTSALFDYLFEDGEYGNLMKELLADESKLWKIMYSSFNTSLTQQQKDMISQEFVMDFILLFQFIFFGRSDALLLIKAMYNQWSAVVKHQKFKYQKFVYVCRLLFARAGMFPDFQNKDQFAKAGKIVKDFITFVFKLAIEREDMNDEALSDEIALYLRPENDKYAMKEMFRKVLAAAVLKDSMAARFGVTMTHRVLRWKKPSQEMINTLRRTLFMRAADPYVYQDNKKSFDYDMKGLENVMHRLYADMDLEDYLELAYVNKTDIAKESDLCSDIGSSTLNRKFMQVFENSEDIQEQLRKRDEKKQRKTAARDRYIDSAFQASEYDDQDLFREDEEEEAFLIDTFKPDGVGERVKRVMKQDRDHEQQFYLRRLADLNDDQEEEMKIDQEQFFKQLDDQDRKKKKQQRSTMRMFELEAQESEGEGSAADIDYDLY